MQFLGSRTALILTAALLLQGAVFYAVASRSEVTPPVQPLQAFPAAVGNWQMAREIEIDKETQDVLRASDTVERWYVNPQGAGLDMFIAYFATQRTGAAPHSPKNCLPGSGWEPLERPGTASIPAPGRSAPLIVNKYVVARGDQRSVVLYWYQSHNRVMAGELTAKLWLIADSIRYRRSDTALVKVVIPVRGTDSDAAVATGIQFIKDAFPVISSRLPA